ncbi:MAG: polysaccharide biosynthesis/export family protein [Gammaproteobacteria bacterium]
MLSTPPSASTVVSSSLLVLSLSLFSCAGQQTSPEITQLEHQARARAETQAINRQLTAAVLRTATASTSHTVEEYRLGPGDVLDISVFQVEELNRKVRVNGAGSIILPLLGEVRVGGMTSGGVEAVLAHQLGKDYLNNPQVSVFVDKYRSQQITVMGAVQNPGVYNIRKPRTVLEMLSESGGLTAQAGIRVYVQTATKNPQTGEHISQNYIIDLKQLLENGDPQSNPVLRGNDSIHVPEAGVVFVEGAVRRAGAYPMEGEMNILKAIAMAGGTLFEAKEGSIQVFRQNELGKKIVDVDLRAIRDNRQNDIVLQEGDIIVVRSNALKKGFVGFWRGLTGIFSVGKSI